MIDIQEYQIKEDNIVQIYWRGVKIYKNPNLLHVKWSNFRNTAYNL